MAKSFIDVVSACVSDYMVRSVYCFYFIIFFCEEEKW